MIIFIAFIPDRWCPEEDQVHDGDSYVWALICYITNGTDCNQNLYILTCNGLKRQDINSTDTNTEFRLIKNLTSQF